MSKQREADAWAQGYGIAAANIMRTHGERQVTIDVIRGSIYSDPKRGGYRRAFADAGLNPADLEQLDTAFSGSNYHYERDWFGEAEAKRRQEAREAGERP